MGSVLEFQQQAMGILTTGKLSDMIVESMKASAAFVLSSLASRFDFLKNMDSLYPYISKTKVPKKL